MMNEIAQFQPNRLPYHAAIQERFGIDRTAWKALTEAVWPTAKTPDSIAMALAYCKARKLDPFKKPVHIVPMWDSSRKAYVETVWPGISEIRTTAFRTGQYAGCDETEYGPEVTKEFTGRVKDGKDGWTDKTVTVTFPEWARITVYRDLNGRICKFVGPKVKWVESYATIGASSIPNDMWESRPVGQLDKCAEAAALRKAFPEEIGNMITAEEMEGRTIIGDVAGVSTPEPVAPPPPPPEVHEPAKLEFDMAALAASFDSKAANLTSTEELDALWDADVETAYEAGNISSQEKERIFATLYDQQRERIDNEAFPGDKP